MRRDFPGLYGPGRKEAQASADMKNAVFHLFGRPRPDGACKAADAPPVKKFHPLRALHIPCRASYSAAMKKTFLPPFFRTLSRLFLGTLLVLVLARGAMLWLLWPEIASNPASDILNALYIGTKFDIRMVVLALIPIALVLGIPPLERRLTRSRLFRGAITFNTSSW